MKPTSLPVVQLKSGWPVSLNPSGTNLLNRARGIAIASNNDIVVTGAAFPSGAMAEEFATVRFKAAGKDGGTD